MTEPEDSSLVSSCLKGNAGAFEILVERYQRQIFNAALRMVKDYDDARDLTQTAFVKAYERLDSFDPRHKFFSWIYRIVINEAINFLKWRRQHEALNSGIAEATERPL